MGATKNFIHIHQIRDGVAVLKNGGIRAVLLVSSMNFDLKSDSEKEGILAAYQDFLNSLDYPLQIFISSREINLDDYLAELQARHDRQENELLKLQIGEYLNFVNSLIKVSTIVAKHFYVVVPYAPGEKDPKGLIPRTVDVTYSGKQFEEYKNQLWQRVKQVRLGLMGLGLRAEPLNTHELIEFFYNFYNPEQKAKRIGSLYSANAS